jgi:hypothetical protein
MSYDTTYHFSRFTIINTLILIELYRSKRFKNWGVGAFVTKCTALQAELYKKFASIQLLKYYTLAVPSHRCRS